MSSIAVMQNASMLPSLQRLLKAAACLALACAASAPALAARGGPSAGSVDCADSLSMSFNSGYLACQGPLSGNIAPGQVSSVSFEGYGSFEWAGASDGADTPFVGDPGGSTVGELVLGTAPSGLFVIGLKGGPNYSLYLFDGSAGALSHLYFDTFGLATGSGMAGPELSHAALFLPGVSPVPEPATGALLWAGLGVVGLLAVRRRAR